jgi:hypothetical protein
MTVSSPSIYQQIKGCILIVSLIAGLINTNPLSKTIALPQPQIKTMAMMKWFKVGFDESGKILQAQKLFPWQGTEKSVWGTEFHPMTDQLHGKEVFPVFYTRLYLSPYPSPAYATGKDPLFVVMDDRGNLWFDPDGFFHSPHADPRRNPKDPSFIPGSCTESNTLDGFIRYSIDSTSNNNTRGPYPIHNIRSGAKTMIDINGRIFDIGILDRTDFIEHTFVNDLDEDLSMPLISFGRNEMHSDNINPNSQYDAFEWIYRTQIPEASEVSVGDYRLSPVFNEAWEILYEPNSTVVYGDKDIGTALVSFQANEKHTDQVAADSIYTVASAFGFAVFPEHIYRSKQEKVSIGDYRLSPVNVVIDGYRGSLMNLGFSDRDALILHEVLPSGSVYTIAAQTNYVKSSSLRVSAKLHSPYGDVPLMASSLFAGTWIDCDTLISVAFFHPVLPRFAGSIGCSWWLDDGINNLMTSCKVDAPLEANLSDDYIEKQRIEQVLGLMNQSPDLDYYSKLLPLPSEVMFVSLNALDWGAGMPLYKDKDQSATVSPGDQRMQDMTFNTGGIDIHYPIGSTVSQGDSDIGTVLTNPSAKFRYIDLHPYHMELSNNQQYDPGEPIYRKNDLNYLLGNVEGGDLRILDTIIHGKTYEKGSLVTSLLFQYYQSKAFGLESRKNGDIRYLDVHVSCGTEHSSLQIDPQFKVEQTVSINITFPDLMSGERMFLFVDDVSLRNDTVPRPLLLKEFVGPMHGVHTLTLTPRKSSMTEEGWLASMSLIYFRDNGGSRTRYREFRDMVKQSWFFENIWDERAMKYASMLPYDFFPDTLNINDALIHPESIEIFPSKNSLHPLDSRVPNFWAFAKDQDNPLDVNDPSPVLSSLQGQDLHANVNANGAGIEYLAVCFAYFSNSPNIIRRFIVQVNQDKSYFIWLWEDTEPKGIFNFGDTLSSQPIKILETPIHRNQDCAKAWTYQEDDPLRMNVLSKWDHLGIFDGNEHVITYQGQDLVISKGYVESYGIPVLAESYGKLNISDPGGDFPIPLSPLWGNDEVLLRVYFNNAILDFDEVMYHPPYFLSQHENYINYLGYKKIPTTTVEDINFTNFSAVDLALQYSDVNYTGGENPLSPLFDPVIAAPYNPILRDLERDFAVYPGGQAHVVRTAFRMGVGNQRFRRGSSLPYNAYPSITSFYDPLSYIRKLGVEHSPFTDYSFFFTLQTKSGEYLSFDSDAPNHLRVQRIEIEGPFKCPKIIKNEEGSVIPETGYPVSYHYEGTYVIDREIAQWYETPGKDWSYRIGFGRNEIVLDPRDANPLLARTRLLDYRGLSHVFALQELIPVQGGNLCIRVYTGDGQQTAMLILVHGLRIENVPTALELNMDHVLKPVLTEQEPFQDSPYCNNALVYTWQDRGIRLYSAMLLDPIEMGAGDGRLNRNVGEWLDFNLDGKISFDQYETEIIGTYDIATNTWMGGVYDGRTFNVNMGIYPIELTEANNGRIVQFGSDFGSRSGRSYSSFQDHIISADEECPVYVTAYKFYDDNNDRAFTPKYQGNSHEVYLSGEHQIRLKASETLIVDVYPSPLTAGCVPELIDANTPLTFTVRDTSGRPLDFKYGVIDPRGRSETYAQDVHQHLFVDTPPEPLPQYYWTRTDLHNDDLSYDCNIRMYSKQGMSFSPISFDFSKSHEGKYSFYNFCANDEGAFEVQVYSPDRTQMGRTMVSVVAPKVEYTISPVNVRGNILQGMGQIQDPDFIMTAGANKFYLLSIKAFNAQGQLIKGVQRKNPFRNQDERDLVFHSGRMTPYTTLPSSNNLHLKFKEAPSPYFLHQSLWENSERIVIHHGNTYAIEHIGGRIYNTTNMRYDSGNFSISQLIDQNDTIQLNKGWGYGCIYNHPHSNIYCFSDLDKDGKLSSEDAFKIGADGVVRTILFAEDVCNFGVLVGANFYSDHPLFSDVVGKAPVFSNDPSSIRGRYRRNWRPIHSYTQADEVFALDWDAFPENDLVLSPPRLTVLNAETGLPYRRDLLYPGNYDLVYGIINHIQVVVNPADPRDFPIIEGTVRLFGNTHESYVHGTLERKNNQSSTRISFMPTGIGQTIAHLLFTSKNIYYDRENPIFHGPGQYAVDPKISFDSVRALMLTFPESVFMMSQQECSILIRVQEKGTQMLVSDATVSLSSSERSIILTSDAKGEVRFTFTPKQDELIRFYVFKEAYLEDERWLKVEE